MSMKLKGPAIIQTEIDVQLCFSAAV